MFEDCFPMRSEVRLTALLKLPNSSYASLKRR